MLYAKIMLDYAHYAHPENLPSMVRYSCRRYGQAVGRPAKLAHDEAASGEASTTNRFVGF